MFFWVLTWFAACTHLPASQTIQVYKHDGSRQCEGMGVSVQEMQKELHGIRVYTATKGKLPGLLFPAVCGGGTAQINIYDIDASAQAHAQARGFAVLPKNKHLP